MAEHRWCARHIYAHWSKKWHGGELRKKFWTCAWCTYEEELADHLKLMEKDHGKNVVEDLMKYNPQKWCRAYISSRSCSDEIENNIAESFNSWINEGRDKAIISLLEHIRKKMMERIVDMRANVRKWKFEWSPECMNVYDTNYRHSAECEVLFNGSDGHEVSDGDDQHCVRVDQRSCTCRAWDVMGIPCPHAITALLFDKKDPSQYISLWFHKSKFLKAYEHVMQPVRGYKFWNLRMHQPIEPPPERSQPGRPKEKRIRETWENRQNARFGKKSKKGIKMKCSKCQGFDHNVRSCTYDPSSQPQEQHEVHLASENEFENIFSNDDQDLDVEPPSSMQFSSSAPAPSQFDSAGILNQSPQIVQTQNTNGASSSLNGAQTRKRRLEELVWGNNASNTSNDKENTMAPKKSKTVPSTTSLQIPRTTTRANFGNPYGHSGMGVCIDEATGHTSYHAKEGASGVDIQPGLQSTAPPTNGDEPHEWTFRYALSERNKLRVRRPVARITTPTRKISFRKEGHPVNLPYQASSDLKWCGNSAVTGNKVQEQREHMIGTRQRKAKAKNDGAGSSKQAPPKKLG